LRLIAETVTSSGPSETPGPAEQELPSSGDEDILIDVERTAVLDWCEDLRIE